MGPKVSECRCGAAFEITILEPSQIFYELLMFFFWRRIPYFVPCSIIASPRFSIVSLNFPIAKGATVAPCRLSIFVFLRWVEHSFDDFFASLYV